MKDKNNNKYWKGNIMPTKFSSLTTPDNFWCNQWQKFRQHHGISFDSVYDTTTRPLAHASFKPPWASLNVFLLAQLGEYTLVPIVTCQGLI